MIYLDTRRHFYWPLRPCSIVLIISILNQVLFIANIHISDPSIVSRLLKKLKEKQQSILKSNVLTTKATEASTIFSSP